MTRAELEALGYVFAVSMYNVLVTVKINNLVRQHIFYDAWYIPRPLHEGEKLAVAEAMRHYVAQRLGGSDAQGA